MVRRVLCVLGLLLATTSLQVAPVSAGVYPPDRSPDSLSTIEPTRILDTRSGEGAPAHRVAAGGVVEVQVNPLNGIRSRVAFINLTIVDPDRNGYATVYPSAADSTSSRRAPARTAPAPGTSTLNYAAGQTVANQAVVKVSDDHRISVYTSASAHVLVDLIGSYDKSSEFGPYFAQTPRRVLDTRTELGASSRPVPSGTVVPLPLPPPDGVDTGGSRAAVLNVTAVGPSRAGYVTVFPATEPRPTTSSVNFARGASTAGMAIVKYDGSTALYVSAATHLVVDLVGWVPSRESDYQPLSPARLLDTRSGLAAPAGPVAADGTVELTVAGHGGVPGLRVAHPPVAVEVNVAAVGPKRAGHLTSYVAEGPRPLTSTLNFRAGETRANSATVRLSADGKIRLHTSADTHLVVDVVGYFVAPTVDPVVTSTALPGATVGQPYSARLSAAKGVRPYSWAVVGDYPIGGQFGINSLTGEIYGTPLTAGQVSFQVQVSDHEGGIGDQATVTIYVHPSTGSSVTQVAAGRHHACAALADRSVRCWGNNFHGEVGSAGGASTSTPVAVPGLDSTVTAVATGAQHSCALTTSGQVSCWGADYSGQLGDGSTTDRPTPATVVGLTAPATAIAAGATHTCALLVDETVECWGANDVGQLGDGTRTARLEPVPVAGLTGTASITVGTSHSCAVSTSGAATCWGSNDHGELGNGTKQTRTTPAAVSGLSTGVASVDAGEDATCAVLLRGDVACWGKNDLGQVRPGGPRSRVVSTPAVVPGLDGAAATVSAGRSSACAALANGETKCWGGNHSGVLGNGQVTGSGALPSTVAGLAAVTTISVGETHACAVAAHAQARCWGANSRGEVGDGSTVDRYLPETVVGLEGSGS